MNKSQRFQAYIAALNEVLRLDSFQVNVQVQPEALGPVDQVAAAMITTPIPNWQLPTSISPENTSTQANIAK